MKNDLPSYSSLLRRFCKANGLVLNLKEVPRNLGVWRCSIIKLETDCFVKNNWFIYPENHYPTTTELSEEAAAEVYLKRLLDNRLVLHYNDISEDGIYAKTRCRSSIEIPAKTVEEFAVWLDLQNA